MESEKSEEAKVQIGSFQVSIKEFAVLVPTLTATLALAYDVGYFTGADLRFFSFFTLAEHLVFALQGVPLIVGVLVYVAVAQVGAVTVLRFKRFVKASGERHPRLTFFFALLTIALAVLAVGLLVYFNLRALAVAALLAPVLIVMQRSRSRAILPVAVIGAFVLSFSFGVDFSRLDRIAPWAEHSIEMGDGKLLIAKLIRAGERGILVYGEDSRQYRLIRWDGIKAVDSTKGETDISELIRRYSFDE